MARKLTSCGHERAVFTIKNRDKLIREAVAVLKTWAKDFDAIAMSGYSSAMIAPIIAHKLKKNLVLVRKKSEERQSHHKVEGQHGQRVLFLDDLIDSGDTFCRIKDGVESIGCRIVGTYLYNINFSEPVPHKNNFENMNIPKNDLTRPTL